MEIGPRPRSTAKLERSRLLYVTVKGMQGLDRLDVPLWATSLVFDRPPFCQRRPGASRGCPRGRQGSSQNLPFDLIADTALMHDVSTSSRLYHSARTIAATPEESCGDEE